MSRKRRHLRPEEEELWKRVARTATPLSPKQQRQTGPTRPQQPDPPDAKAQPFTPEPFRVGGRSKTAPPRNDLSQALAARMADQPVAMDGKAFGRLRRGKLTPEARIDLHGMTLAQAHPALTGFILNAQASGRRLVLVITGKGRTGHNDGPIPERHGVLKHQVPQWLRMAPLGSAVLQIAPAHQRHGGSGAYYVYLRRQR